MKRVRQAIKKKKCSGRAQLLTLYSFGLGNKINRMESNRVEIKSHFSVRNETCHSYMMVLSSF